MSADTHVVHLEKANNGTGYYRWRCTCGRSSRLSTVAGKARAGGQQHAKAQGGFFRER